jgi:hypothetical protein
VDERGGRRFERATSIRDHLLRAQPGMSQRRRDHVAGRLSTTRLLVRCLTCVRRVYLALLALALSLALVLPRAVSAEPTSPRLEIVPAAAGPGETLGLRGNGWPAGAGLGARLYEAGNVGGPSAPLAGQIVAGPEGAFATTATVPLTLFGQGSRGNLNVVPGPYTVVVNDDMRHSVAVPFTVAAPAQAALLWGEVAFDLDGNGVRDPHDQPTSALVSITGASGQATAIQAITDARGRFVVSPVPPGEFHLEARAGAQDQNWLGSADVSAHSGRTAQADLLLEPPPPSGVPASLVALQAMTLYVAAGDRLIAFDLSDPVHPAFVGQSAALGADIRSLTVAGQTAAAVLSGGGVRLLNVASPDQPEVVASYPTPYTTADAALLEQSLLIPSGDAVVVLDISTPASPRPVGAFQPGAEVRSVTAAGRYAYVVTADSSLRVVDMTDPSQPVQIGSTRVEGAGFLSPVAVAGGNAFGTFIFGHYTVSIVIDVSDPVHPVRRAEVSSSLYTTGEAFAPRGDLLYVANQGLIGFGSLGVVSITNPSAPALVSSQQAPWDPLAMAVRGPSAYVLGRDHLLHVLDIGTPPSMRGVALAGLGPVPAAPAASRDERYFAEAGYRIDDDAIWDYFRGRGGLDTFGYPVSRTFTFLGCPVQLFQREVAQHCAGSGVQLLNVLDPELFPYTRVNFSTFPAPDESLKAATPKVGQSDYATAMLDFVAANAPDAWSGQPVNFRTTFFSLITPEMAGTDDPGIVGLFNLEVWGAPISQPAADPNNPNFVYQRFQRGIMHFDASSGVTRGILLADYLKAVLRGEDLPADLRQQAAGSALFAQYCPGAPGWTCRPDDLPGSDLTFAFEAS